MLKFLLLCLVLDCVSASDSSQQLIALFDSKKLAKEIQAKVVNVYAYREDEIYLPFELGDLESMLFGDRRRSQSSSGTGCIIDKNGIIVTCNHVVGNSTRILIGFSNGRKLEATKIWGSAKDDIAFLKVKTDGSLPFLQLADHKTNIDLGEEVLVAGNAFGMGGVSIYHGLISFINRVVDGKVVLQSDANIGVGISGGPMVDSTGSMIGMAFAIPRAGGLSFFIPSGVISYYYNREILKKSSPWWGVEVQAMSPEMLDGVDLKDMDGVIVTELAKEAQESKSLKQGDVIVQVNGQRISSPEEFDYFEKTSIIGDTVEITVWRDKELQKIQLVPVKEPETVAKKVNNTFLKGVEFEKSVAAPGVIVKNPGNSGLFKKGDVLLQLNNKQIKSIKDIEGALKSNEEGISVVIDRNGAKISQSFSGSENGNFFSQSIIVGQ